MIIPNDAFSISRSLSVPLESVAAGALLYVIVDPLAPNWQIEETRLDAGRYLIALKKKRFTTGGDGEAAQVFYRRAAQLVREQGAGRYRVVEFTEGVESNVLIAQRVAQGKLARDFELGASSASLPDVMVSIQKANVSFQQVVQVRNRLVSAYHEIMNMQV